MQRLKFSFYRHENLKYISHLDIMRTFHRAIRRAELPVALTQGFNPQLRMSIALPLAIGITSEAELAEVYMERLTGTSHFLESLNSQLPDGIKIFNVTESPPDAPQLMQLIDAALYHVKPFFAEQNFSKGFFLMGVEEILNKDKIVVKRIAKKKIRDYDIRPYIINIEAIEDNSNSKGFLKMYLQTGSRGGAKPAEVMNAMGEAINFKDLGLMVHIHRVGLYHKKEESNYELLS